MDERMFLYLNNLVASGEANQLVKGAQVLLVDGPSPKSLPAPNQELTTTALLGHCSSRQPIRSLYELDGIPLSPGGVTPTTHPDISIFHRIMQEVGELPDLFSLALVNRASYLAFKSDELRLMKSTVKKISSPA
ncbi:hypothetical protein BDW74DRAFT_174010 [Aspergillus multicolor]|uniref:uncharacterized protein n=1 Tax=Aspergillus multicolor TaxID=41759 RepID=UPI003CCE2C22